MTTHLATQPVEDPDQLALIADDLTPLAVELAEAFREACRVEAFTHDGWVDPNRVRARLAAEFGPTGFDPRRYSAMWAPACGREGFLDKTDRLVPIVAAGSRGNGNKSVAMRRWRGWPTELTSEGAAQ